MKKTITVLVIAVMTLFAIFAFAETAQQPNRQIVITNNSVAVYIGKTARIEAAVEALDESAPRKTTLVWTSADPSVAKVAANGTVSGVSAGQTVITVQAKDDESILSTVAVEVRTPVKAIALDIKTANLLVGSDEEKAQIQLTHTIDPVDAYNQDVVWTSSDEKIAGVDEKGFVTAYSPGNVTITATSTDTSSGKKASVKINVTQAVQKITFDTDSVNANVGQKITNKPIIEPVNAKNKNVEWKSSDEAIATVSNNGQVTAKSVGQVTISATALDTGKITASYALKVLQPVTKITLSENKLQLAPGIIWPIESHVEPENASDKSIIWTSSNEDIVSVLDDGVIIAKQTGKATITASSADGGKVKASVGIEVKNFDVVITKPEIKKVSFSTQDDAGFSFTVTSRGAYQESYTRTITISGDSVAITDQDKELKPVKPGISTVTVKSTVNRKTQTKKYTVFVSPGAIEEDAEMYNAYYEALLENWDPFVNQITDGKLNFAVKNKNIEKTIKEIMKDIKACEKTNRDEILFRDIPWLSSYEDAIDKLTPEGQEKEPAGIGPRNVFLEIYNKDNFHRTMITGHKADRFVCIFTYSVDPFGYVDTANNYLYHVSYGLTEDSTYETRAEMISELTNIYGEPDFVGPVENIEDCDVYIWYGKNNTKLSLQLTKYSDNSGGLIELIYENLDGLLMSYRLYEAT